MQYVCTKDEKMTTYKAAFFDMDGVLVDSMGYHCQTWIESFLAYNINFDPQSAYRNEGRTGASTINLAFNRQLGRNATEEEINNIYNFKTKLFKNLPPASAITDMSSFVLQLKADGVDLWVVTGSAQKSIISRLEEHYPNCFSPNKMITGNDVIYGKPNPEPYLKALKKSGHQSSEVFVIENAPLGVRSAVAANIVTIAINTGILPNTELLDEQAKHVFTSANELLSWWNSIKITEQ